MRGRQGWERRVDGERERGAYGDEGGQVGCELRAGWGRGTEVGGGGEAGGCIELEERGGGRRMAAGRRGGG